MRCARFLGKSGAILAATPPLLSLAKSGKSGRTRSCFFESGKAGRSRSCFLFVNCLFCICFLFVFIFGLCFVLVLVCPRGFFHFFTPQTTSPKHFSRSPGRAPAAQQTPFFREPPSQPPQTFRHPPLISTPPSCKAPKLPDSKIDRWNPLPGPKCSFGLIRTRQSHFLILNVSSSG